MYRYCSALSCPGLCCDSYGYCTYPSVSLYCYKEITYYYYDYWWVYVVGSILFLAAVFVAVWVARRRRRRRMQQNMDTLVISETPSYTMGEPVVYNDQQNQYINQFPQAQPNGQPYNQQNQWAQQNNNGNMLSGNAQNNLGYEMAKEFSGGPINPTVPETGNNWN